MRPVALGFVLVVVCSTVADEGKKPEPLKLSAEETAVIAAVNAERAKLGVNALKAQLQLFDAARAHAANMAKQQKLAHDLDGQSAFDRITATGYKYGYAAENIGWNYPTPQAAIAGWMTSDAHRANMLNKDYVEIGVAVAKSPQGERYWVQVFASPQGK